MSVKFEDNSIKVKAAMKDICVAWLHEAGGELQAQTKRNTPVDTGQLKGSWSYEVDESAMEATVGSGIQNAIWNEFGTGQYALNGDGQKTPWVYKNQKGEFHRTAGKKPQRSLFKAFQKSKAVLQRSLANKLKGI